MTFGERVRLALAAGYSKTAARRVARTEAVWAREIFDWDFSFFNELSSEEIGAAQAIEDARVGAAIGAFLNWVAREARL